MRLMLSTITHFMPYQHPPILASLKTTFAGFCYSMVYPTCISGVERLVSACQAAPNLNRIARPNTTSFLFTEIMNDGAFRGTLRGLSMNFLQTSLVLWPSVLITNRSKSGAA